VKELLGNRGGWTEARQLMARARLYFNGPTFSLFAEELRPVRGWPSPNIRTQYASKP